MSASNGSSEPVLRLAEVGLSWPPEPFIALKLTSLADRGVNVRVASFLPSHAAAAELEGVALERLPHWTEGPAQALSGLAGDVAALAISEPRRMARLFAASSQQIDHHNEAPRAGWRLLFHLARLHADVIHFEWLTVASTCLPALAAWDRPVVVSCRGSDLPKSVVLSTTAPPAALPTIFARAAAVHCVSEAVRRDAVELGLDPAKAWLIRGGVDPNLFRPPTHKPTDKDHFSVVSVGDLRWLKGHEYALLAIAELARQGIPATLEIIGDDPGADHGELGQRTRILHTARHLGIHERVHLHGRLQPTEVSAQLRCADALLHTSLSEGLPNVVLEAMACGLPVVATNTGGTGEAIRDGIEGFLIPPRDPHAAANALTTLWHNPPLRQQMGHAGRTRAQTHFTLKHQTDQWITLYRQLARDGQKQSRWAAARADR